MDEFSLIHRYLKPLASAFPGALGLTDDAALLDPPPGQQLVVTADAMVAGVHFLGHEPPALIARKLLRVNLSDLAAKGAAPWCYFLTAALPHATDEAWIHDFTHGLAQDQAEFHLHLAGGDTTATPGPLTLSLTALGLVPHGQMLSRGGARPGDALYVSGPLGEAAMGLKLLKPDSAPKGPCDLQMAAAGAEASVQRYLLPQPRLALGAALRGLATACMDISDGLAQDAGHLCAASGAGAHIEAARIPRLSADLETALTFGDDYELLFTLTPAAAAPEGCTRIGSITAQPGVRIVDENGAELHFARKGYQHFT